MLALILAAACDTSAGSDRGGQGSGKLRLWAMRDDRLDAVLRRAVDRYNVSSKYKVEMTTYGGDAYWQKLQEAMGTPAAPDVFVNWGGATLTEYVTSKQVADLSPALGKRRTVGDAVLPAALETGKINGRQYGLPMSGAQPFLLFYNKDVFAKAAVAPPKTYDDLLSLVDTFKARKITPIALAGARAWATLAYPMYLLDRIGGQQKFADIAAGRPAAWRDPAVLKALAMCQDLAKRGAFGDDFISITYDSNPLSPANPSSPSNPGNAGADDKGVGSGVNGETASTLLATGSAAMHVMGAWEYARQLATSPDFARSNLGWTTLPAVTGGSGDARNVVGPPGNLFSISSTGKHRDAAADFVAGTVTSDAYVDDLIKAGEVPTVKGADAKLSGAENADFATFVFRMVADAPAFTAAWDQALSPELGAAVAAGLQKLLVGQATPDEFVAAVENIR